MRRFEVYFLQKKVDGAWDTLERAQSVSVLVASLVREFDSREDAEVRILAGSFDESAQDWEFTQIFFVDRSAVELALTERAGDETDGDEPEGFAGHESDDEPAYVGDGPDDPEAVPGGREFADAIRRASDDGEDVDTDGWKPGRRAAYDDLPDGEPPIGPPPRFDVPRRRSGQAFFVIGTIVIALILTGAAVLALGIALDAPQVKPVLSMFRNLTAGVGVGGDEMVVAKGRGNAVMPETTGQVITFQGVAAALRGRWSPGHCDETYIEFDEEGLVVGARGRPESLKVPVVETLEDDYTWYVRRSPDLVEHFQKLGKNDIQLVGDTTRAGFSARTSDILTRCP
ncbi:hypothetical protein [Thalassobaculum sp.]|uniref:hypothetical protein n=1 Tax=Thalassobaculum sp. TaxID=2022740 RepID=UPI0032EE48CA